MEEVKQLHLRVRYKEGLDEQYDNVKDTFLVFDEIGNQVLQIKTSMGVYKIYLSETLLVQHWIA